MKNATLRKGPRPAASASRTQSKTAHTSPSSSKFKKPKATTAVIQKRAAFKKTKPQSDFLVQCKKLYSHLMTCEKNSKNNLQEAVQKLIDFFGASIGEKCNSQFISRSLQACLKYGTKEQRETLWNRLQGHFQTLIVDKYSHKLMMKFYLYLHSQFRKQMFENCLKSKTIWKSQYGIKVLEYIFDYDQPVHRQRELLYRMIFPPKLRLQIPNLSPSKTFDEIYTSLSSPHQSELLLHMLDLIHRLLDKGFIDKTPVHMILRLFCTHCCENECTDLIDKIDNTITHLLSTKYGVEVLINLLGYTNAKKRKAFLKQIKTKVLEMCKNSINYIVIIRLLRTVDDTKQLHDCITKEMIKSLFELTQDKYASRIVAQIFSPDISSRFLTPYAIELCSYPSPTSLKNVETRYNEVCGPVSTAFLKLCMEKDSDGSPKWLTLMKHIHGKDVIYEHAKAAPDMGLMDSMISFFKDESIQSEMKLQFLDDAIAHRTIQKFIGLPYENPVATLQLFWEALSSMKLSDILQCRGVFVLITLCRQFKSLSNSHFYKLILILRPLLQADDFTQGNNHGIQVLRDLCQSCDI